MSKTKSKRDAKRQASKKVDTRKKAPRRPRAPATPIARVSTGAADASAPARQRAAKAPPSSPDDALAGAFARWQAGERIHALAAELKLKRSKVRRALIALAGGKEKFRALRAHGAGGTAELFGGQRAAPRSRETIAQDDSTTFRITRADAKASGWTSRVLRTPFGSTAVLIDPTGLAYGRASATERAALIFVVETRGIPDVRMKPLAGSALERFLKASERQIERGEALIEQTAERKRTARATRKARKTKAVQDAA